MFQIFRDNGHYILRDKNNRILLYIDETSDLSNLSFEDIVEALHNPYLKPKYRLSVLNPDETIKYIIPNSDLILGGLSYTENYQQGQRRNLTVKLNNAQGQYIPMVNNLQCYWLDI